MADQNRNQQSNPTSSRDQQGQQSSQGSQNEETQQQGSQNTESEPRRMEGNQANESGRQGNSPDDESVGVGGSEHERSNRQPASVADDRGQGGESRRMDSGDEDLDSELGVESDLDSEDSVDEEDDDDTGSNR